MTRIKVCGLSRAADIEAVNAARPDYAGFILDVPSSHRSVTPHEAAALIAGLDPGITPVGIFVDQTVDEVVTAARIAGIAVIQLHGVEDDTAVEQLRQLTDLPVWQAFKVNGPETLEAAARSSADLVLLDNGAGSGQCFDWTLISSFTRPYLLAGGLTASNIPDALAVLAPFAVDLSSGVETRRHKDPDKVLQAVQAAHAYQEGGSSPMSKGRFGAHGGQYIPETLMSAIGELEEAYEHFKDDPAFNQELTALLDGYCGRPSRLYYAARMTADLGGAKVYLKREDLNHTGSHKINNAIGQCLLAKKMGKTRVIAETGAGQHGVATATAAALLGLECEVYMGRLDTERQALNVYRMQLLGAQVHPVDSGTATLKDAVSETFREWVSRIDDTHYVLGSIMGPHPFPTMVRDFQAVISKEIAQQVHEKEGRLPDAVIACVGGGSNAIGAFYHFIDHPEVSLIGCEAAGRGVNTAETAATLATGRLGIFHGMKSYFCQDGYGQIAPVYSISAGLDYPGIGPEHAHLFDTGRARYVAVTDDEAVAAFEYLSRIEGIIPAIESAHAIAYARTLGPTMSPDKIIVINVSGRGDKDCAAIARYRGEDLHD
jgi:phosphoribosylanthranilate isomerase